MDLRVGGADRRSEFRILGVQRALDLVEQALLVVESGTAPPKDSPAKGSPTPDGDMAIGDMPRIRARDDRVKENVRPGTRQVVRSTEWFTVRGHIGHSLLRHHSTAPYRNGPGASSTL